MKTPTFYFTICAIGFALIFQNCKSEKPGIPIPADGWKMPLDVADTKSREDWLNFGWESFIALNWPADNSWPDPGQGGRPAMDINITDKEAAGKYAVWQTYFEAGQLFLKEGEDPGTWDNPVESIHTKENEQKKLPVIGGFGEKGLFFLNQDPVVGLVLYDLATTPNPVIDQSKNFVLIEAKFNQSEFEYFKQTGYYDACVQSADLAGLGKPFEHLPILGNVNLPEWANQGAVEVKASWKILMDDVDIKDRYFTTEGYFLSPDKKVLGPYTFGLVGLHVLRNTPSSKDTWYWTTFEQVDNVKIKAKNPPKRPDGQGTIIPSFNPGPAGKEPNYSYGYDIEGRLDMSKLYSLGPPDFGNPVIEPKRLDEGSKLPEMKDRRPVNCSRVIPITDDVEKINKKYQDRLAGTPWQYYEMVDALYPDPQGIFQLLRSNDKSHKPNRIYANTAALINTTMETYLAFKPSDWKLDNCLSCHYDAEPRGFGNQLRSANAEQVFSYMYRRAQPKYPDKMTRYLKKCDGCKIEGDTIRPSIYNCDSIKFMREYVYNLNLD